MAIRVDSVFAMAVVSVLVGIVGASPRLREDNPVLPLEVIPDNLPLPQLLTLPSNATAIRNDITDSFQCEGRDYGYYADVDNDCQLFHVCLPVTYADGRNQTFRWSFICPEETVFNQEMFTCTRADEAIDCQESPRFYELNRKFGSQEEDVGEQQEQQVEVTEATNYLEEASPIPEVPQIIGGKFYRRSRTQQ